MGNLEYMSRLLFQYKSNRRKCQALSLPHSNWRCKDTLEYNSPAALVEYLGLELVAV